MSFRDKLKQLRRLAGTIGNAFSPPLWNGVQDPLPPNATEADRRLHAELRAMENDMLPPPESAGDRN